MRHLRQFLAGLFLVVLVPFGVAGVADAAEETEHDADISHVGECVEQAVEEGLDPDECVEAPNPILPATDELIWGGISFAIVLFLLWKLALPPIRKMMEDRTEKIRGDLDQADEARTQAEAVLADYQAKLTDAKTEANRIIEEARQTADQLRADLQQRAEADIGELRQRAQADIESAKSRAIDDLKSEVANIAVGAAEVVVRKNLDATTQTQLIDDYIEQLTTSGR